MFQSNYQIIHPELFGHRSLCYQIGEHKGNVVLLEILPSTDLDPGLALCVLHPRSALRPIAQVLSWTFGTKKVTARRQHEKALCKEKFSQTAWFSHFRK